MDKSDFLLISFVTIVIFGFSVALSVKNHELRMIKSEAVKRNYATFAIDEYGKTQFRWK